MSVQRFTRTDELLGTREITIQEDDPGLDGTGFEHPAWHRGLEYGFDRAVDKLEAILEGKDTGAGIVNHERFERLRRKLIAMVGEQS